jgi:hypothetical protein
MAPISPILGKKPRVLACAVLFVSKFSHGQIWKSRQHGNKSMFAEIIMKTRKGHRYANDHVSEQQNYMDYSCFETIPFYFGVLGAEEEE